jgi:hypothetical protein
MSRRGTAHPKFFPDYKQSRPDCQANKVAMDGPQWTFSLPHNTRIAKNLRDD